MTVIAWDGQMLAADKRVVQGGSVRTTTKIYRVDALLVGVSGLAAIAAEALAWVRAGRNVNAYPKSMADPDMDASIVVISGTQVLKYSRSPYPVQYEDSFFAMGSGRDFAMMAMHLGKTAREAVELTCLYSASCGNGVDVLMAPWFPVPI